MTPPRQLARPRPGRTPWRPTLEALETRLVPATVAWNSAADGNWNDCGSWRVLGTDPPEFRCPGPADDAVANPDVTITFSAATGSQQVRSLSAFSRIRMTGGTLTVAGDQDHASNTRTLIVEAPATFRLLGSTMTLSSSREDSHFYGTLDVRSPATWFFATCSGGTQVSFFHAGATWTGNGQYEISACGSVQVEGALTASLPDNLTKGGAFPPSRLTLNADVTAGANLRFEGGLIDGSGRLTVPAGATMTWSGGTMGGSGTTVIAPGATLRLESGFNKGLQRRLENLGTTDWGLPPTPPVGGDTHFGGAAMTFVNQGTFNLRCEQPPPCDQARAILDGGTFDNEGLFEKFTGTDRLDVNAEFNNSLTGTFRVSAGSAFLAGSGRSSGTFATAAGAGLGFLTAFGSRYDLLDGTRFAGDGVVGLYGPFANVTIAESLTVELENFTLASGTLSGPGNLVVTNQFTWTSPGFPNLPSLALTGTTTIPSGATLDIRGAGLLGAGTLVNKGNATWTGTQFRIEGTSTTFENRGTFFLAAGEGEQSSFAGLGTLRNTGTVAKTGAGALRLTQCVFVNDDAGTVDVQSGILAFSFASDMRGTFAVAAAAEIRFDAGAHMLNTGAAFTGAGFVRVTTFVQVQGDVTADNFGLDAGTLTGTGTLTVTAFFDWTGGTMADSNGITRIGAAATLSINGSAGKALDGRTLALDGYTQWYDSGNISLNGATIINNGYFDIYHLTDLALSGFGFFNNAGYLTKAGPARTTLNVLFSNNGGYVGIYEGALSVPGAYNQDAGYTEVYATLAAAGGVDLRDGDFVFYGQITGNVTLSGVSATLSGAGTITGNLTNGGTIYVGGDGAAGTLTVGGNYVQGGTGVLTIELGGTASDQLLVGGTATLDGVLNVLLLDDFFAEAGADYRVLEALRCNGTFARMDLPDISPFGWDPRYDTTGLTLGVV